MALSKREEAAERPQHEWERYWSDRDYVAHNAELVEIHGVWKACMADYELLGPGRHLHPDFMFQQRMGGMTANGAVIHDTAKSANGEWQSFDINCWKLDKMKRWLDFSQTPEELAAGARRLVDAFRIIGQGLGIR